MKRSLRFYVMVLPNLPWPELVERFRQVETLGFDLAGFADHFVDWSNPQNHWYELWTWLLESPRQLAGLGCSPRSRKSHFGILRHSQTRRERLTISPMVVWRLGSELA